MALTVGDILVAIGAKQAETQTAAQIIAKIGAASKVHASSHVTGGTDKIRDANASQDGLMTSSQAAQLSAAILETDLTSKGQIIVATGSGTFVVLSVGADGQVLTADSAEASGVKWAAGGGGGSGAAEDVEAFSWMGF